ncbi:IclR family transcriptional regulator C-terminal domain-containing protein, partial [uncultured Gimesia sp.]|uniref:IclR family transcriptional regulator domain-containing protein n=1 Tax=uncultured Gimesia sp. TaxID=1678688 RepID=UPI0026059270
RIPLTADTPHTITEPEALKTECERIRSRGYSTDYAEADEGIHCVAAPILGPNENLLAVVWVSAPSKRMPKSMFASIGKQVLQCADEIAGRLSR